jgi:hypothetical protein
MVVVVQPASICIRPARYNRWQGGEGTVARHTPSMVPGHRMPVVQHWHGQEVAVDASIRVLLDTLDGVPVVLAECTLEDPLRLGIVVPVDTAAQPNVGARMRADMVLDAGELRDVDVLLLAGAAPNVGMFGMVDCCVAER